RFYAKPRFVQEAGGSLRLVGVPVPEPEVLARDGLPVPPWSIADRSVLLRWLWDRELRRRDLALYQANGPAWDVARALIARFAATVHGHGARMILLNIDEDAPWLSAPLAQLSGQLGVEWVDAEP